jgi:hypothetical protein
LLRHRSLSACKAAVSSAEFTGWLAYRRLLDERRQMDEAKTDLRHASLMTLLANANRDTTKRPKPFTVDEFLIRWDAEPKPVPNDDELLEKVKLLNAAFGGRVN